MIDPTLKAFAERYLAWVCEDHENRWCDDTVRDGNWICDMQPTMTATGYIYLRVLAYDKSDTNTENCLHDFQVWSNKSTMTQEFKGE